MFEYERVYAEIDLDAICKNVISMKKNIDKLSGIEITPRWWVL